MTTNRIISVYDFIVVIMLLMYSVLIACILLGTKLLLLLIMLVGLLSPGAHLTKDNSVEFRIQLNLSSIEFEEDWNVQDFFVIGLMFEKI